MGKLFSITLALLLLALPVHAAEIGEKTTATPDYSTDSLTFIDESVVSGEKLFLAPLSGLEVDWSNVQNIPAGFADGVDNTSAGGGDWTQVGADLFYNTGNVGIGNTNPTTALDVTGTSTFDNVVIRGTSPYITISEGQVVDDFELTLALEEPTADRTQTFINANGNVSLIVSQADCSTVTTDGVFCRDTDDDQVFVGNGTSAVTVGGGTGGIPFDNIGDPTFPNSAHTIVMGQGTKTFDVGPTDVSSGGSGFRILWSGYGNGGGASNDVYPFRVDTFADNDDNYWPLGLFDDANTADPLLRVNYEGAVIQGVCHNDSPCTDTDRFPRFAEWYTCSTEIKCFCKGDGSAARMDDPTQACAY